MIKLRAKAEDGTTMLGIGLSYENIARLMSGQPIRFNTAPYEVGDFEVLLLAGETEEHMVADLREAGANVPDVASKDPNPQ